MKSRPKARVVRSVFAKLLGVILVAGVCLNLLMGGFFHYLFRSQIRDTVQRRIVHYVDYLIQDMGIPPSFERAREIAASAALKIRYDDPDRNWSTDEDFAPFPESRFHQWGENPGVRIGRYRGHYFIEVKRGAGRFLFELAREGDQETEHVLMLIILLGVSIVLLTGAYFWIRRILRPIKWLAEGVDRVGRGELDHRVPVKSTDELRDLAEAFNDMTGRLGHMLHANEQLLVGVSHELRSPLARMRVALEFVPDGKARESLAGDIDEVEAMITEILETARLRHAVDRLARQPVDLAGLVKDIVPAFDHLPPGVELSDLPNSAIAYGDSGLLKTVVNNIVSNAVKYSRPAGGPVRISVVKLSPHVIVRVEDQGAGIPAGEIPFIFEPFYRADKSRSRRTGGYGLGLSLCKTIMEAHKGKIEIQSRPAEGTTVSLYFPDTPPKN